MYEQKVRLIFNLTDKNASSRVVSNKGIAGNYIEGIHAIATEYIINALLIISNKMNKLERTNVMEKSLNVILFIFLISVIHPVDAAMENEDMTSHLICPCECAMIISTCDCTTAIQVKKEIYGMKENGFSEKQIISALKAEYGNDILVKPQKDDTMLLWVGVSLAAILVFLVYILSRKPKPDIIPMPGREKYERLFEEEYRQFVSELGENEEPDNKYSSKKGIV